MAVIIADKNGSVLSGCDCWYSSWYICPYGDLNTFLIMLVGLLCQLNMLYVYINYRNAPGELELR